MSLKEFVQARLPSAPRASLFDLLAAIILVAGGLAYHWDFRSWTVGVVGDCHFGDAEFWWDGAVRVGEANFNNHPGSGYRPGFFVLAGLTLPVLGSSVQAFYTFLLALFLSACVLLYLTLRDSLGRAAAFIGAALSVFNPYTGRWLATPTTDGLGLLLHMLALACLLRALAKGLHRGWLASFGVLFALGTLTRPLVTPYIGVVVLCLLFLPAVPFRKRALAAGLVVLAFLLPTFLWTATQRALVKEWSLSTNDAGAFYAASVPGIQVWNSTMYDQIAAEARVRFQVSAPTLAQINHTFWKATIRNYKANVNYHLGRIVPHLWLMACFPPPDAPAGTAWWQAVLLAGLAGGLCLGLLRRRQWCRALLLCGAAGFVWLSPQTAGFMTCAGAVLALLRRPGEEKSLGAFLLACYWLCGVAALYLTGGTWGPPLVPVWAVNALGSRLGTQVAFSGGLLACFFLCQVASLHLPVPVPSEAADGAAELAPRRRRLLRLVDRFLEAPNPVAGRFLQGGFLGVAAAVLVIYAAGITLVAQRAHAHHVAPQLEYPDLSPVVEQYRKMSGHAQDSALPVEQQFETLASLLAARERTKDLGGVLTTGRIGPLLWSLDGQERTLFRFHPEKLALPDLRKGRSIIVQVPARFQLNEWAGARGAFVLCSIPDSQGTSHLAQYIGGPVVRAFVPLAEDSLHYDLSRSVLFPLDLFASQLEALGSLKCVRGKLDWTPSLPPGEGRRRFGIFPEAAEDQASNAALKIDLTRVTGQKTLSFAYQWTCGASGSQSSPPELCLRVEGVRRGTGERILLHSAKETSTLAPAVSAPVPVRFAPADLEGLDAIELTWTSSVVPVSVGVYELVLRAEEFQTEGENPSPQPPVRSGEREKKPLPLLPTSGKRGGD
jgi:4-amino-4-deoxy-L-arabinose transferase-like glycosyltransferase